ncbi:MAG: hypothetical protein FWC94_00970 [Bacteroidales bacterium]|nr:hypothetical protein [Bacteroidales bacterium]
MKAKTFLVGLLGFLIVLSCAREPIPTLPEETQEGLGTFGCLVNGELVRSRWDSRWGGNFQVSSYYDSTTNQFRLETTTRLDHRFEFFVSNPTLGQNVIDSVFLWTSNHYYVARNVAYIYFTRLDHIASGTFAFDAERYNRTTHELIPDRKIQVRRGRFDVGISSPWHWW